MVKDFEVDGDFAGGSKGHFQLILFEIGRMEKILTGLN